MNELSGTHGTCGGEEIYIRGFCKERDQFEDLDVGGKLILKWICKKWYGRASTRLIWLRIRTNGGLLRMR